MVIQAFDQALYCCVNDRDIYALEKVPEHAMQSKDLDPEPQETGVKKQYIPPMNHPWRRCAFKKFVQSQPHRTEDETAAYVSLRSLPSSLLNMRYGFILSIVSSLLAYGS